MKFRTTKESSVSKKQTARKAKQQYQSLINTVPEQKNVVSRSNYMGSLRYSSAVLRKFKLSSGNVSLQRKFI